jgi:hypothetical protein
VEVEAKVMARTLLLWITMRTNETTVSLVVQVILMLTIKVLEKHHEIKAFLIIHLPLLLSKVVCSQMGYERNNRLFLVILVLACRRVELNW